MKPEDIIELAKKVSLVVTLSSYDSVHKFAALHRQALIDSGELVPRDKVQDLAKEALDDIESWSAYASDYFKTKWNLDADLKKWSDRARSRT